VERFNLEEILKSSGSSENNNIEDFLISIETLPLLSDLKIIQVDNFDLIKKQIKKNYTTSMGRIFESIKNILKKPPDYIWFLFTSKAIKEKDFNKQLYQLLKESWQIQKFVSYDNSYPLKWVIERAKIKGLPMTTELARLFLDVVGNDLSVLDNELEKISIYFIDREITYDLMKKIIRSNKHFSIFKMIEALSKKELIPALEILQVQIKSTPNEYIRFFSLVVMHFRRLLIVHCMIKQFYKETEILNKIQLPPFLGNQLLEQSKNFTFEELQKIYSELVNLDLRIKFHGSIAPILLQDLFQHICSGKFKMDP